MFNLILKVLPAVFTMSLLAAPSAEARCFNNKKSMSMKSVPRAERDDVRKAKAAITGGGGGLTVFRNEQNCLPAVTAKGNDQYYEFDLGRDRQEGRGKHRLVIRAGTVNGKRGIVEIWYTDDHYNTFTRFS